MVVTPSDKQSILIVDDVPANIKMLGEVLRSEYKVRIARDGHKALSIAASGNPPDLILLDVMMPEIDGYEVLRRLKHEKATRNIPVIFITAKNQEEDETYGLDLGAVDYITKPFSLSIVKARVRTHLELKRHRDLLECLSTLDGLTGIPNRRRFDECMELEWTRAVRESTPLTLVMIDIDHFKLYNDTYGHATGDDCLRSVAKCLMAAMRRPADFMARYGGEEFACILPATDVQGALFLAEKMRLSVMALQIPHQSSAVGDCVTISIGSATINPTEIMSPLTLIEGADHSLYQAKNAGRNRSLSRDLALNLEFWGIGDPSSFR